MIQLSSLRQTLLDQGRGADSIVVHLHNSVKMARVGPEKKELGPKGMISKWGSNPALRRYCMFNTNIVEPKPLLMLREATAKHERFRLESTHDVAQFLVLLMRMNKAKTILEVGSFTGKYGSCY